MLEYAIFTRNRKAMTTKTIGRVPHSSLAAIASVMLATTGISTPAASAAPASPQKTLSHSSRSGAKTMTHQSTGAFDVKMTPQPAESAAAGDTIGRMLLDKKYHGSLDATGKGQMLAMRTPVDGSAGYVAMELVVGKLDGRSGSFVLQHSGIMNRGAKSLTLSVVPDSGTGELTGLSGTMDIIITDGKHRYKFDYSLPPR
jgi:Protein of unknown function (DUF3224)